MIFSGNLIKMRSEAAEPIRYFLPLGETEIDLNPLLGKQINIKHNGVINCVNCSKRTSKSYGQGFCYNCFIAVPEADESVVRPELSKAHLGIARNMEWAVTHDLIDHFVYLAVTSDLKVGVTRNHQIPTRWIDQGAVRAIKLAQTPNRHIAGIIEVFLKQFVADKTNWQAMLKGEIKNDIDLVFEKIRLGGLLPMELQKHLLPENQEFNFTYPSIETPRKVISVSLEKESEISGILTGIKGQYLIFDNERVINIRSHSGFWVNFTISD
jgi:hypothetical protein